MKTECKNGMWVSVARFAATRLVTLYIFIALACVIFLDVREMYRETMSSTLNRLIPDFTHFIDFIESGDPLALSKADLAEHLFYYQYLEKYLPGNLEVQNLLGFIYYHSGQTRAAISAYEKAATLKSVFFWTHYNLGVLYAREGRISEALTQLDTALKANLPDNLNMASMSRVYFPMLVVDDNISTRIRDRLKGGVRSAFSLIMMIHHQQKDYENLFRESGDAIIHGVDNDGRFYYYFGLAALHLNRLDEAISVLSDGINKFPDCKDLYLILANIYQKNGQEERALKLEMFLTEKSSVKKISFPSLNDFELRIL